MALPVRDAATILCDPPWSLDLGKRTTLWSQVIKALKIDGRALLYAPWLPIASRIMNLDRVWVRELQGYGFPRVPILFSEWTKLREYRPSERTWLDSEIKRKALERDLA